MKSLSWPRIPSAAWRRDMRACDVQKQTPKVKNIFDGGNLQGVPLGGFGTGGIGRDWQGSFRRWTLKTGALKHFVEPANGFAVRQKPQGGEAFACPLQPKYPDDAPDDSSCRAWYPEESPVCGTYHGLFPKAWFSYEASDKLPVEMVCEQHSGIRPHDYEDISYPVGVFRWTLRNTADVPVETSLLFSFANMNGWFTDYGRERPLVRSTGNFNTAVDTAGKVAVVMDHTRTKKTLSEGRGQFAIATETGEDRTVSRRTTYDIRLDAKSLWEEFRASGSLTEGENWKASCEFPADDSGHIAGALTVTVTLQPGEIAEIPFSLAWDMPVLEYGTGRAYYRRHTRHVGTGGDNGAALASLALDRRDAWSAAIDEWHESFIARNRFPEWYYGMLFNELYLLVDGLTVWTDKAVESGIGEDFFGVIECPDYPLYNTLDLWVYASFALIPNWPELERNVITHFAKQTLRDDPTPRRHMQTQKVFPTTRAGMSPHDLGAPYEDPIEVVNSYSFQDATGWKDLNSQFIVTVWRDYSMLKDEALLRECWPAVEAAIEKLNAFDRDGDGLIENEDRPDNTFDMIPMSGPGSYCNGLWLAALAATCRMAETLGCDERAEWCRERLDKGRKAFVDLLWTGTHFRVDTKSEYGNSVFAEALFGIWYARVTGLGDLVPEDMVRTTLKTVFETNCLGFKEGSCGVMNISGVKAGPSADGPGNFGGQADEALVGFNFSAANQFAEYGLEKESAHILKVMHDMIYDEREMWFRTPAAMRYEGPVFRAVLNLRPLAVWGQEGVSILKSN